MTGSERSRIIRSEKANKSTESGLAKPSKPASSPDPRPQSVLRITPPYQRRYPGDFMLRESGKGPTCSHQLTHGAGQVQVLVLAMARRTSLSHDHQVDVLSA